MEKFKDKILEHDIEHILSDERKCVISDSGTAIVIDDYMHYFYEDEDVCKKDYIKLYKLLAAKKK